MGELVCCFERRICFSCTAASLIPEPRKHFGQIDDDLSDLPAVDHVDPSLPYEVLFGTCVAQIQLREHV